MAEWCDVDIGVSNGAPVPNGVNVNSPPLAMGGGPCGGVSDNEICDVGAGHAGPCSVDRCDGV